MAAAIANAAFFQDHEPGAEIYTCGFEKDQAALSWEMAKQMVQRKLGLRKRCKILKSTRLIEKPDGSVFKPLSHEAESKHGFSTHLAVFDELHTYRNSSLIETLTSSCAAREEPLMLFITTADYERPNSPCNEKHDYAKHVQNNPTYDLGFLPVVYEVGVSEDWKDPKVWAKANPGLGKSVSLDFLSSECKKAQNRPSYTNAFKRLYLNIRTNQDVVWLQQEHWVKCYNPSITMSDLIGQTCHAGLDLASTRDLCALAYWFPELATFLVKCWAPRRVALDRKETNKGKYLEWAEQGYITLTPGNVADYNVIKNTILQDSSLYNIATIGVDRWNSTKLITELTDEGFDVIPFGQGYASISAPTKEFERLVMSESCNHMNNPLLTWCLGNTRIKRDPAENIKPDKEKSTDKIDGIVASIMALGMAMLSPGDGKSVYETSGLLTV